MPVKNAYDVLGIAPDANRDQIDAAFRNWAKVLHPDACKRPTAEAEFKKLNEAYDLLKDDEKRRQHDYSLVKRAAKDVPSDEVDDVLDEYDMSPKKKKKRKKKPSEPQVIVHHHVHHHPQGAVAPLPQEAYYDAPPEVQTQHGGYGQADYTAIPDGYDPDDSLGGMV